MGGRAHGWSAAEALRTQAQQHGCAAAVLPDLIYYVRTKTANFFGRPQNPGGFHDASMASPSPGNRLRAWRAAKAVGLVAPGQSRGVVAIGGAGQGERVSAGLPGRGPEVDYGVRTEDRRSASAALCAGAGWVPDRMRT